MSFIASTFVVVREWCGACAGRRVIGTVGGLAFCGDCCATLAAAALLDEPEPEPEPDSGDRLLP